jgi:hypothetical protein
MLALVLSVVSGQAVEPGWWVLPGWPFLVGSLLGTFLTQALIALAYRRANRDGVVVPAVASMFTMQGISGCGHAPGPLPLFVVLNSFLIAMVLAAGFAVDNWRRAKRASVPQAAGARP